MVWKKRVNECLFVWVCKWAWSGGGFGWGLYAPFYLLATISWPVTDRNVNQCGKCQCAATNSQTGLFRKDKNSMKSSVSASDILRFAHTLFWKATVTSKTLVVLKVSILRKLDWFCLKTCNLPFVHAKFCSRGSSSLASIWFLNWIKFDDILFKNNIVLRLSKLIYQFHEEPL